MQFFVNKEQNGSLQISDKDNATYQVTISRIKLEGITINKMGTRGKYINIPRTGKEYKTVITYVRELYIGIIKDLESCV